ncbi:hypothetical protein AM352_21215 [Citrobacter koseri]|nr:hypothetical protein AM352_21215 [Citrobacter koseri]PWY08707.1 hypothetical protein DL345_03245 [Citrobacter koseri]
MAAAPYPAYGAHVIVGPVSAAPPGISPYPAYGAYVIVGPVSVAPPGILLLIQPRQRLFSGLIHR